MSAEAVAAQPTPPTALEYRPTAVETEVARDIATRVITVTHKIPEGTIPVFMPAVKDAVIAGILAERARCTMIIRATGNGLAQQVNQIEGGIEFAIASGDDIRAKEMGASRALANAALAQVTQLMRAIGTPPGACQACSGTKLVPADLVLAGGQRPMVPCSGCAS